MPPRFRLLPPDDLPVTPGDQVDAAAAALLDDPYAVPQRQGAPVPFGRTWRFDFDAGRMERAGGGPRVVSGHDALIEWCQMALRTARYAHAVFSDRFGMERPDGPLGLADPTEEASDYAARLTDALVAHERITAVEDVEVFIDREEGAIIIDRFVVVTDEGRVGFGDITIGDQL